MRLLLPQATRTEARDVDRWRSAPVRVATKASLFAAEI